MKKYEKILAAVFVVIFSSFCFVLANAQLGNENFMDMMSGLFQSPNTNQSSSEPLSQNGIDTILNKNNLNITELAIRESGMDSKLSSDGPYTIFVPTDAVIKKLPEKTLKQLMTDSSQLTKVLQNHIVSGTLTKSNIDKGDIKNLNGNSIKLTKSSDGTVMVNGQKVTDTKGINFSNGTIYIIDGTIMP